MRVFVFPQAGWTALHLAAKHEDPACARLLIQRRADPNAATEVRVVCCQSFRFIGTPTGSALAPLASCCCLLLLVFVPRVMMHAVMMSPE
jgi:hypothetical protein